MTICMELHPDLLPENTNTSEDLRRLYPDLYSSYWSASTQSRTCRCVQSGLHFARHACAVARSLGSWTTCVVVNL
jgi:hypothetical protein